MGEIREAGASTTLRQLLFAKLRARASVAAAYAAAMRLLAIPLDRRPLPSGIRELRARRPILCARHHYSWIAHWARGGYDGCLSQGALRRYPLLGFHCPSLNNLVATQMCES